MRVPDQRPARAEEMQPDSPTFPSRHPGSRWELSRLLGGSGTDTVPLVSMTSQAKKEPRESIGRRRYRGAVGTMSKRPTEQPSLRVPQMELNQEESSERQASLG